MAWALNFFKHKKLFQVVGRNRKNGPHVSDKTRWCNFNWVIGPVRLK